MRGLGSLSLCFLASSFLWAQELSRYPILQPDVQAHYLSSTDRTGGNDDGFDGTYSELYTDENGEHVILDVEGPGTLYNLWFTSRVNGWSPLGSGHIKFYFDGEPKPRLDMDIDELFSGRHPPFVSPFVYHAFQSTGGYVSYMPFPFRKHLKVTTEKRVGFYNAYYHTYASDRAVESWTADAPRWDFTPGPSPPGELLNGTLALSAPAMPDGEMVPSRAVVLERAGEGAITSLRFNPLFPLTPYQLNHVLLRIYWDGKKEPSVAAPLGSFFGSGLGEASVDALPLGMSPSGPYYCRFPMPFWNGFRMELVNENPDPAPQILVGGTGLTGRELLPGDERVVSRRLPSGVADDGWKRLHSSGRGGPRGLSGASHDRRAIAPGDQALVGGRPSHLPQRQEAAGIPGHRSRGRVPGGMVERVAHEPLFASDAR